MIRCHSKSPYPEKGLLVYTHMRKQRVSPNMHTFPITIKACTANLSLLSQIHAQTFRFGFHGDVFAVSALIKSYALCGEVQFSRRVFDDSVYMNVVCWTSLVTGYCNSGMLNEAREIFDEMPERNDSSWSAMITGYVQNDQYEDAIELFHSMMSVCPHSNPKPNASLLVSVLNACACLGASELGKWVHSHLLDSSRMEEYGPEIATSLMNFYAKIGHLETSKEVFDKMTRKDATAWSAMIMGLAINGNSNSAIDTFYRMLVSDVAPNSITFISVLTACSHGGLIDEGLNLFKDMIDIYGISPTVDHYGCMIDLLSRAGHIINAQKVIEIMPMKPDAAIWGALLNGCIMHGFKEVGKRVGKVLIELEPDQAGRYVGLANIYAATQRWEGVSKVRRLMKDQGVKLDPGWSSLELNDGCVHRFHVDDRNYQKTFEMYEMLKSLAPENLLFK